MGFSAQKFHQTRIALIRIRPLRWLGEVVPSVGRLLGGRVSGIRRNGPMGVLGGAEARGTVQRV